MDPTELAALLENNGVACQERATGDLCLCCPFCPPEDPDEKYKCYLTPSKGIYHCFRCNAVGGIRRLLRHLGISDGGIGVSMEQLRDRVLKAKVNKAFKTARLPKKLQSNPLPIESVALSPGTKSILGDRALRWLYNRGLDEQDLKDWEIHYCPKGDYAGHLILPVRDQSGLLVTFQSRRIFGTKGPKSRNPLSSELTYSKADVLYGLEKLFFGAYDVVLVEGPFDAIALNRIFIRGPFERLRGFRALALFGHQLSNIQRATLASLELQRVYVMMDSDVPNDELQIAKTLSRHLSAKVYACQLREGDPDDLTPSQLKQNVENAKEIRAFVSP